MPAAACRSESHDMEYLFLIAGVVIGVLLGTLVVAFSAVGSYDRGFEDGRRHFVLKS